MTRSISVILVCSYYISSFAAGPQNPPTPAPFTPPTTIFGYRNPAAELKAEQSFLAVPDPQLAKQHLQILTAEPHVAGSAEDRKTAEYVCSNTRQPDWTPTSRNTRSG